MSEHDTEVYISLDFKKHRIRVYKQTLGYMGNPDYVYLLIDPKEQQIGLFSSKVNAPDAHKVDLKKLGSDNSYELYSKCLFFNIHDLYPCIDERYSYRLTGRMIGRSLAVFQLRSMQRCELI